MDLEVIEVGQPQSQRSFSSIQSKGSFIKAVVTSNNPVLGRRPPEESSSRDWVLIRNFPNYLDSFWLRKYTCTTRNEGGIPAISCHCFAIFVFVELDTPTMGGGPEYASPWLTFWRLSKTLLFNSSSSFAFAADSDMASSGASPAQLTCSSQFVRSKPGPTPFPVTIAHLSPDSGMSLMFLWYFSGKEGDITSRHNCSLPQTAHTTSCHLRAKPSGCSSISVQLFLSLAHVGKAKWKRAIGPTVEIEERVMWSLAQSDVTDIHAFSDPSDEENSGQFISLAEST
ncbi:uncharacterized protein PAC_12031 [Phialocephala subalpina]|uniref:Uncharacterized protein n=1 Tax=Phialocephala subalpina TaxID=576137 RepID=A0A1L7XAT1_9HELO|nr:uncharacterized protein PAC_12031 [Phialocephala subalpina]